MLSNCQCALLPHAIQHTNTCPVTIPDPDNEVFVMPGLIGSQEAQLKKLVASVLPPIIGVKFHHIMVTAIVKQKPTAQAQTVQRYQIDRMASLRNPTRHTRARDRVSN